MPATISNKICNSHVKKLMDFGLAYSACKCAHNKCITTRPVTFVMGQQIKSYVNDLILDNLYDIMFGADIPLEDNTVISNAISTNTSRQRREKNNSRSIPNYVIPSITSIKI